MNALDRLHGISLLRPDRPLGLSLLHHGAGSSSSGFDWFDIVVGIVVVGGVAVLGWVLYRFATRPR